MRAHRKIGRGFNVDEIRAEAHKRQKEMGDAARAAEMTEEKVALEKPKGLAEKAAARRAATRQAGKDKHAAGEAKRWAATGQADKDKHAGVEAARWAATGQAGRDQGPGTRVPKLYGGIVGTLGLLGRKRANRGAHRPLVLGCEPPCCSRRLSCGWARNPSWRQLRTSVPFMWRESTRQLAGCGSFSSRRR